MNKTCFYCKTEKAQNEGWIKENHYQGAYGRILKECLIGGIESREERQPVKTIYYCSLSCMMTQHDKEENELWEKGDCQSCKKPLAVINEECLDLEHKQLGCLLPINTPEGLKK